MVPDIAQWRGRTLLFAGSFVALLLLVATPVRAALPDGRVYEQVTPVSKQGADVLPNPQRTRAAADGSAVEFASLVGFGDVRGVTATSDFLAKRDPDGQWRTHGITPTLEPATYLDIVDGLEPRYVEFSNDLSHGVFLAGAPLTAAPNVAAAMNLYGRDDLLAPGPGAYGLLTDASSVQDPLPIKSGQPAVVGASADFSHIAFESIRNLTAEAVSANLDTSEPKLYEWVNGTVRLIGILPAGEGGGASISQAGQGAALRSRVTDDTISESGSRVAFTGPPYNADHTSGVIYLRDDQGTVTLADDVTVRVSAPERTDCDNDPTCGGDGIPDPTPDPGNPGGVAPPAAFQAMSADGSKVFFTTSEQLTDDDVNSGVDLYRYDLNAPSGSRLTRLSVDSEPSDGTAGDVTGVLGASRDGDYVYFASPQQLVAGNPVGSPGGPRPGHRIYVWHDGSVREVGAVNTDTEFDALVNPEWAGNPKAARVSPDGTHLVFVTQGTDELLSLYAKANYDHGSSCPALTDPECAEAYVYDASASGGAGDLQCASCNPTGQAATADAKFSSGLVGASAALGSSYLNHPLSDDGRFVFFSTAERLTADDHNEASDVYEFDTTTGQVHLISSGRSVEGDYFMDASADGHDVFFTTRVQLSPTDTDDSRDLYDARIGGTPGHPAVEPPVCVGDACKPPASAGDIPPAPPSFGARGERDHLEGPRPLGVFSLRPLGAKQRRGLARSGTARLVVSISQPGVVWIRVRARIGSRLRTIESLSRVCEHGTRLRVRLRLNRAARRELADRGRLALTITSSYSHDPSLQTIHVTLRSTHA